MKNHTIYTAKFLLFNRFIKTSLICIIFIHLCNLCYPQSYKWAKSIGSGNSDYGRSITTDATGNVYITGDFYNTADFDPGAGTANLTSVGLKDIFFAKYTSSGSYLWAKSIGSSISDYGYSIATDATGNVYITGRFQDTADFDPGAGTANLISVGLFDIFFAKYDSSGNYLWAKNIGSSSSDWGTSITTDNSGNVYIAGRFQDTADFDPGAGTVYLISAGGYDIFFAKYNSNGSYLWVNRIGGTADDLSLSITTDNTNNVFITGNFKNTNIDFNPGAGTANLSSVGGSDIFFAKYDSSGNYLWAKSIGGSQFDYGVSITTNTMGNVYITGRFRVTADFDPGAGVANLTSVDGYDIFFAKYDSNGSYMWAKSIGGTFNDYGVSITTDTAGNVYITGYFSETADFDPGIDFAYLTPVGGSGYDIFFAKYASNGSYMWAKNIGSTEYDRGYGITTDPSGNNIYITGAFKDTADFDPGAGIANLISVSSGYDIFFAKYLDCNKTPITTSVITSNITCVGGNNGSATVTVTGGTPPYSYQWDDPYLQTSITASQLLADTYTITITDSIGCNAVDSAIVTESPLLDQSICLITVDSTSSKNVIVWEKPVVDFIDSFRIYRDIIGVYTYIGSVAYNDLSEFIDVTLGVNPNITSYRYKLSVFDTCGNESALSNYHKTILLQISLGVPPAINLSWDDYEGFIFTYYRILRDSTGSDNWETIDSVSFGINAWTDPNPPQTPNLRYLVEVIAPDICTATLKTKDYNSSKSNTTSIASPDVLSVNATSTNATQGNCDGTATANVNGGTPPYTYIWSTSPVQTTVTATGLCGNTTYTVIVTDSIGEIVTTSVTVNEITGIANIDFINTINIYPNPNTGEFTLEMQIPKTQDIQLNIFNILGQTVYAEMLNNIKGNYKRQIDLNPNPTGIYNLQILNDNNIINRKIILNNN